MVKTEALCYGTIVSLSVASFFTDKVPLVVQITCYSLAIIIIGANKSLDELILQFKKVHIDGEHDEDGKGGVETVSKDDAAMFPLYAGGMLVTLYGLIKVFGKEVVNPLLLAYLGIGFTQVIKEGLESLENPTLQQLDKKKICHVKVSAISLDLEVSVLDILCLVISYVMVAIYMLTKNWIFNNVLAIVFCINGIQNIFLGNF